LISRISLHKAVDVLGIAVLLAELCICAAVVQYSSKTTVDHYSMTRHERFAKWSCPMKHCRESWQSVEVEIDECYLTFRKYLKGRHTCGQTVTLLRMY